MTVQELIASLKSTLTTRIDAVFAGDFDGNFIVTDEDNIELEPNQMIEITAPYFRRALYNAGVEPRGGGKFAFGGPATIDGTFQIAFDSKYPIQMTAFTFLEIRRLRRPPIRVFPPIEFD